MRFGLRTLGKSPTFTVVAVIALAPGVGADTAIFSVVNTLLLRPLPYQEPGRLVMVWEEGTADGFPRNSVSAANFVDWREQNQVFEGMAILADPTTLVTISLVLVGVALLASYLPARRAARVDPLIALRYE